MVLYKTQKIMCVNIFIYVSNDIYIWHIPLYTERYLQENQRYQGTFHTMMGTIKDRNGMDLKKKKAEDIKKRWEEYTE